jgi:hypothetical protein
MPKLPNAVILSVLAAVQVAVTQSWPEYWFSPIILAAVLAAAKIFQVQAEPPATTKRGLQPYGAAELPSDRPISKLTRWLVD